MIVIKIAITGTPGVGKSTVSSLLIDKLESQCNQTFEYIDITKTVKEHGLYSEKDEEMDSYVIDFQKFKKYLSTNILTKSKNILLDGHVSHLFDVDYIIVLRCNPEIIIDRLRDRKYSINKINENVEAEILDVCLIESLETTKNVYEIDASNKSVVQIVDEIINAILNKKTRYGIINWIDDYHYLLGCSDRVIK